MAIVDWVVYGDFHTYIINMIYGLSNKNDFEEALRKLECRIIRNSIIAGIKDDRYWKSCYIMPKLMISEEDLDNLLISISPSSNNDQIDPENKENDSFQFDTNNVSANKEQKTSKDSLHTEETEQTSPYSQPQEPDKVNERVDDTSISNIRFEEMTSYEPIKDKGPDLKKLYGFLVDYKVIDGIDSDTFEKCVSHAYFLPMYKDGEKVNILYTISKLANFYPKNWRMAVCKNINVSFKRITQKSPCKKFNDDFPSLNFKK